MINIQKTGNAIVVDFTDNDKYLNNGTIEVAPNELMVVIDDSNMATFKKMSNGDTLFGQLIDQIKIQGESVTKDNIIEKFGTIGFSISSGGGGGAVNSVNGQTGDVVITATSLGAITKADADTLYATTTQLNSKQDTLVSGQNIKTINGQSVIGEGNIDITEGGTIDSELSTVRENAVQNKVITNALNEKASKTELSNVSTSKANKADVYTKQEIDNKFTNTQSQINQISTDTAATNAEVQTLKTDKQDTLVSGTNIKTINGQSLLGEGNIEIQQSELPIASADTLGGVKVGTGLSINPESGVLSADSPEWNNISGKPEDIVNITERLASKLDTATYNSEKSSFATKDELNSKADASAITDMATQTWVQNQGYLTEVPSNYVTDSELTEGLAGKQDIGDYALKSDLNTLATKEELATKADASALSSKQDTLVSGTNIKTINGETILGSGNLVIQSGTSNWDDIQGKPQFAGVATSGNYNDLINKPTIPDVSDLATKQALVRMYYTLVSGTNIKTINGNSVLGAGDITIQAGGTIDTAMSDTSENAVQNKVIKKYIDDLVGNILTQLQEINGTIA